ncbi:hypothetical protein D9758_001117 [Tetrapyrgos nigripes]|uniref:Uncharacterized protein n=1 Tax=Tetrapyrgos nigripes TaxID=182062 RepID=A0A8H5GRR0_9AGAR|nr:hypothetical protein D9758_001117 [Tetrapyrgos nigripes]
MKGASKTPRDKFFLLHPLLTVFLSAFSRQTAILAFLPNIHKGSAEYLGLFLVVTKGIIWFAKFLKKIITLNPGAFLAWAKEYARLMEFQVSLPTSTYWLDIEGSACVEEDAKNLAQVIKLESFEMWNSMSRNGHALLDKLKWVVSDTDIKALVNDLATERKATLISWKEILPAIAEETNRR